MIQPWTWRLMACSLWLDAALSTVNSAVGLFKDDLPRDHHAGFGLVLFLCGLFAWEHAKGNR
jgi:hypothetical protein